MLLNKYVKTCKNTIGSFACDCFEGKKTAYGWTGADV